MSATMTRANIRRKGETLLDDTVDSASRLRSAAGDEIEKLLADVDDLLGSIADVTDTDITRVRDRVEKTVAATRRKAEKSAKQALAQGREAADSAVGYVQDRPWTALGVAAAIGLVIGALSVRR